VVGGSRAQPAASPGCLARPASPNGPSGAPRADRAPTRNSNRPRRQMDLEERLPNTLRLEDECRALLVGRRRAPRRRAPPARLAETKPCA
jgi:hypothetical protein